MGDTERDGAVARLAALFRGLPRAHGVYVIDRKVKGKKKVEGKADTRREPVTLDLWDRHARGVSSLGIIPVDDDGRCWFGAIDIDKYDVKIEDLEAQCAALALPLLPTRSKSGGTHLYAFADEIGVQAALMKQRLEEWAVALGHAGAEVFPKQASLLSEQDVGNWINMPYFNEYGEGGTNRYGIWKGERLTLDQYLDRAEIIRVTEFQLTDLAPAETEGFEDGPPCLQSLGRTGFGEGQRNKGMFAVGVYLKKRFPDHWQTHFHGYNERFMRPPLPADECQTIIKSLKRKDYNYTCSQHPIKDFCNRGLCRTRKFGIGTSSQDWGIIIDNDVIRVGTDPPYWICTVNGTRMQLFSEHFMMQRNFQALCLEKIGHLPPPLPADKWREEVNRLLSAAQNVDAPDDSSASGELLWHLTQFLTVFPKAETREEITVGKPFTDENTKLIYFRGADFRRYLEAQHYRGLSAHKLYARLREAGVEHKQIWIGGSAVQVWCAPIPVQAEPVVVPTRTVDKGGM